MQRFRDLENSTRHSKTATQPAINGHKTERNAETRMKMTTKHLQLINALTTNADDQRCFGK